MPANLRRQLIDLGGQRAQLLQTAENALTANNQEEYTSTMQKLTNLNTQMTNIQNLIDEKEREFKPMAAAERRDMVEDRVNNLRNNREITFTTDELRREIRNIVTVASGNIVEPVGVGSQVNDPVSSGYSSIVDQVRSIDANGLSAWQEPYLITRQTASVGDVATVGGTARPASDPTFGVAELTPVEVSVTTFLDRNVMGLSNTNYYEHIYGKAMISLRSEIAKMIVNGDGLATPKFFGIANAKNKAGENIFATANITALDESALDTLYFAYGDDETIGANARLLLTKANLKVLGQLRGTNEKRRLFEITPDSGNANCGVIRDGGLILPYTLNRAVTDNKLFYGDPQNYLLALFGGYTIRVDESYKAGERLLTILGDVKVGGNLTVHEGFVNGTIGAGA